MAFEVSEDLLNLDAATKPAEVEGDSYLKMPEDLSTLPQPEVQKPWLSKVVPRSKVEELAQKYGESAEEVEKLLEMKGSLYESELDLKIAEAAGDNPVAKALGSVASTGESIKNYLIEGLPNSVALNLPWKLKQEAAKNPKLYDEIDRLAEENKGYLQSISEGVLEAGLTAGAGDFALAKAGVTAKASKAAEATKNFITKVLGGKLGAAPAAVAKGAIQLAPQAALSGAVGAAAGYGGSRSGEEMEAMRNYGALFAAIPFAGVGGAKTLSWALKDLTGWTAKKIGIGAEKTLMDIGKFEKAIEKRAPVEADMLEVAAGRKKVAELGDKLNEIYSILAKGGPKLKTVVGQLEREGFKGDATKRAKEIIVETQLNKKFMDFAENFLPFRTALDKADFAISDTVNEFSSIDSLAEMNRWLKSNKSIDPAVKSRLLAKVKSQLATDFNQAADDKLLSNIKSSLTTEWLEPRMKALAGKEADEAVGGLASDVKFNSVSDARKFFDEADRAMARDPEYMQKLWRGFRAAELTKNELQGTVRNYKWKPVEKIMNWLSPRQHVLDSIDRRFGTNLALPHQRLMRKLDAFQFSIDGLKDEVLTPLVKDYDAFLKAIPEALRDERLFMNFQEGRGRMFLTRAKELGLYKGPIPGGKEKLNPAELADNFMDSDTLQKFKEFSATYKTTTENLRSIAKERLGMDIAEVKNYFRHQLVGAERGYGRLIELNNKIKGDLPEFMSEKAHRKLLREDYNYRQLYLGLKAMYQLGGSPMPKEFGRKGIDNALEQLEHLSGSQLSSRMAPNIYSAYRRKGGMPDILRETDPIKVLESWLTNTVRGKYIRGEMLDISKYIPTLERLGAKEDAAFIKDYVRAAMGQKADFLDRQGARMARARELAEKYAGTGADWEERLVLPEQVKSLLTRLMQTNLLSSPFTALRNLEQVPFLTATEIGGAYGQSAALRGMMEAAIDLTKRGGNIDDLYFAGKVPAKVKGVIHSKLLRPKTTIEKAQKVEEKYGNALMWVFGKAETANRLTTLGTARAVTRDLATGKNTEDVLKFIDNINSPALRKNLRERADSVLKAEGRAAKSKAAEALKSDLEDYLLERTQFHYSGPSISKAAEFLGPLLSTFTRYTTEIQGDVVSKLRDDKARVVLEKYLYPALYMYMFMEGMKKASENNPKMRNRLDAIMGTRISSHVPGASIAGMFSLIDQPAPALALGKDLYKAVMSREPRDITKAINDVTSFVPVYKPLSAWVDQFGYRALGGRGKKDVPISGTFNEAIRRPVVEFLSSDEE